VGDSTPPALSGCGSDVVVQAVTVEATPVAFDLPTATDAVSLASVTCSPASGSLFRLGSSSVLCSASDSAGNTAACEPFNVEVVDNSSPTLAGCPGNTTGIQALGPDGAVVTFEMPTATHSVSGQAQVTCSHQSGDKFPFGSTFVYCTAKAASGGNSTCPMFEIRVVGEYLHLL
jgi:hypothetical protein